MRSIEFERFAIALEFSVAGSKFLIVEVAGNIRDTLSATVEEYPDIQALGSRIDKRAVRLIEMLKG